MDSSSSCSTMKNTKLSVRNQTQFKKSCNVPASKKNNNLCMREQTIFKKAFELSTLCDVEICVIYYGRDGELIKTWPEDQTKVRDMAERFRKLSDGEKRKKSTNLSQFLNKKISDEKKHDDDNKLSEKLFEMEASLESRLRVFQDKLRLLDYQTEPCAAAAASSSSLIVDHHQQRTEEPLANQDQRQSPAVYSGFPTDLPTSSSSLNHPTNFSIILYNHGNGTFTQLPSTFDQPAIPHDFGYSDSLLGGQGFDNIELPPLMQTQSQFYQNASWNQTTSFGDPMMVASYN